MPTTWDDGTTTGRLGSALEDEFTATRPFDATRYGVVADGTTDVSTQLQAAVDAAAANGARVDLPPGIILAKGIQQKSFVLLQGHGGGTTLKLPNGANQDLLTVNGFGTLTGGATTGGPEKFGLRDLVLDGNKANNASGWPFRVYGRRYLMSNVEIRNGKSGGAWSQWGTGGDDMEAAWLNWRIYSCDGVGLDWNGPHDSDLVNGWIIKNTGKGMVTHGQATSEKLSNVHAWGTHTHGFHFLAPVNCEGCEAEGATTANLVLDCNFGRWHGGAVFGTSSGVETAIRVGQDATARYWDVDTRVYGLASGGKPLDYVSSNKNHIRINLSSPSGVISQAVYGTPAPMDHIDIWCGDTPKLAADWSDRKVMGAVTYYSDDGVRGAQINVFNDRNYLLLDESAGTPGAVADAAVLYCEDNGSGKTRLMVRFASGASQQIAIQP